MSNPAASLVDQAKQWATNYGAYPNGEEGAVLTVPLRVRGAWENNDADGIADVFVDNGSMLFGDEQLTSRDQIREYLTEAFEGGFKGSKLREQPVEIRPLGPGVALAVTEGGVLLDGETEIAPERATRTVYIVVKKDGDWRLFSHQTSPVKG